MSLELCILASGSAGNAAIIRSPAGILLIDAGIGPRTLEKRLDGTGVRPTDIAAVCLTHLDGDHFSPHWVPALRRLNIPIYCHANKIEALALCAPELVSLTRIFDVDTFHDALRPQLEGFRSSTDRRLQFRGGECAS